MTNNDKAIIVLIKLKGNILNKTILVHSGIWLNI